MIVLGWLAVVLAGLGLAFWASTRAVGHARVLVESTRIPPFFVGVTLLAVGTDLPEIANSLVACATGHGDLNAGDSIGSSVTQATLVLGLLPFLGGAFTFHLNRVLTVAIACAAAVALGAGLMWDGWLSNLDGLILIAAWVLGSFWFWKKLSPAAQPVQTVDTGARGRAAAWLMLHLALVGIAATAAVTAANALSELLGVPEYIMGFFALSLGTSLPELIVDVTALRGGLRDVALGDVLGSSFVDATLSLGIGPLAFAAAVSPGMVLPASLAAIGAFCGVALIMTLARQRHGWLSGGALIATYVGLYFLLLR